MTAHVQAFAEQLGGRTGLPVALQDERLTQPRSREPPGRERQGLAVAQEAPRRGRGRDHPARPSRRAGPVMRRLFKLLIVAAVLAAVAAGVGGYVVWTRMHQAYRGFTGEQFVEIPQGAGSRAIGRRLADAGVVPRRVDVPRGVALVRARPRTAGGRIPVRRCRVAARDRRAAGPGRCPHASRSPFPKA